MRIAIIHSSYIPLPEGFYDSGGNISEDKSAAHVEANIQKTMALIEEAGKSGADVAVTNEDFPDNGHSIRHVKEPGMFRSVIARTEAPLTEKLCEISKRYNMLIAANSYEIMDGKAYNTSKLIGRDGGIIGRYRKIHLPSGEKFQVQPSVTPPEVYKTDVGNIGFATCYDINFAEHFKTLALRGADIIIHQTQGWGPGGNCSVQTGDAYMRVRAAENGVYLIVAKNEQGEGGYSSVYDNYGSPVAMVLSPTDQVLYADIRPDFDMIDPYDYDNFFMGTDCVKARHLLGRVPETYSRLVELKRPEFSSERLRAARFYDEKEWTANVEALDTMDPERKKRLHW